MAQRKDPLVVGEYYHIFNKSIAGFRIFNSPVNCERFIHTLRYYQWADVDLRFSKFLELMNVKNNGFEQSFSTMSNQSDKLVEIMAYCLMPTHVHLILKQLKDNGISEFMGDLQNSYSRYFNTKYNRTGPLWVGRFKNVLVDSDAYLIHLTCYLHLNPVSAGLVKQPEQWPYSSYHEYCTHTAPDQKICEYGSAFEITQSDYRHFVEDRISYQRELELIKHLVLE